MSLHLNLEYIDWSAFDRAVEKAEEQKMMADTVRAGGNFLETIFHNGDEPKWSNPIQREKALVLSEQMAELAARIGVIGEDERDRHVAKLIKATAGASK